MSICRTIALACLLSFHAAAEFSTRDYRFYKPVHTKAISMESIAAIPLDAEAYAQTADDYRDLRLALESTSSEIPFLLKKQTSTEIRYVDQPVPSQTLSLKELPANRLEIEVRLENAAHELHYLIIDTPMRNYEKRVSVYASNQPGQWQEIVRDQAIFDFSRYLDISRNRIELPAPKARYFKIVIDNVTDLATSAFTQFRREVRDGTAWSQIGQTMIQRRDFRIDRLIFGHRAKQEAAVYAREQDYPVVSFKATHNLDQKQTEIIVETNREPLTAFALQTPSRNFNREVRIQVRRKRNGAPASWTDIGRGTIGNLTFRNDLSSSLTVGFPETRAKTYRILVLNQDNPPLTIGNITGRGPLYRALLIAEPETAYRLYFGHENGTRPVYDTAIVLAALQREKQRQPVVLTLGPLTPNPDYRSSVSVFSFLESKLLLGGAVLLVLAGLSYGIVHALRNIGTIPEE